MSGLAGIWNLDGRPVGAPLLAGMSRAILHRGPDGEGRWIDGPAGLAFQNLWVTAESIGEAQPLVRTGESVTLFDGRLDNRDEILAALGSDREARSTSSDAVLVAAVYRRFGEQFAERLNGDFASAIFDIRRQTLLLARDPLGVRPLYFSRAMDVFLFASEVKAILAHPAVEPRPNAEMLATALLATMGQDHQGWTFFDGVSSVLPGQIVIVRPTGIAKRIYWDFGVPDPIRLTSVPEYAEAFRHHFERAVARRLRSAFPVAVSVSGGLDSSSIYCMGETLRRRRSAGCPSVVGVSTEVQAPLADERVYLDAIERQYGTRIHRVPAAVDYARGPVRRAFLDVETPYFRGSLDATYRFQRAVRALGARVLLSGLWGDQVLFDTGYLIDFALRGRWATVAKHLREFSKWSPGDVAGDTRSFLRDLVRYHVPDPLWRFLRDRRRRLISYRGWYSEGFLERARQAERHQQFRPAGRTAHQRSLYQFIRPMYYVQGLEIWNKIGAVNGFDAAYPFFDRDLVSFLLAIPGGVACSGGVPKGILRTAMHGILPPEIAARRGKAEITLELGEAMDRQFDEFARYLDDEALAVKLGYVDPARLHDRLRQVKSEVRDGTSRATQRIGDLFGLELWLQSFFGTRLAHDEEP